jgi:ABC-2 type transport system ATP-binding protein
LIIIDIGGRNGSLDVAIVQERLEKVAGVTSIAVTGARDGSRTFEIESEKTLVRGDLARAVVESGWDLNELRTSAMSLEEVFLELTGEKDGKASAETSNDQKAQTKETSK